MCALNPSERPPTAYLVRVDLAVLARHLGERSGERCDAITAARWLTQGVPHPSARDRHGKGLVDRSPFVQTDEWGVFYSAEDPHLWLDADEILSIRETPPRKPQGVVRAVKIRRL